MKGDVDFFLECIDHMRHPSFNQRHHQSPACSTSVTFLHMYRDKKREDEHDDGNSNYDIAEAKVAYKERRNNYSFTIISRARARASDAPTMSASRPTKGAPAATGVSEVAGRTTRATSYVQPAP